MTEVWLLLALASSAAYARPLCPDCSVVVIGFDDVRADRLAPAPGRRLKTPNLDAFASSAAVFAQAVSPAPWTLPAFMSWFTAQHPSRHKIVNKFSDPSIEPPISARLGAASPGVRTLAQILRERGWKTAAMTGGAGVGAQFGFSAGFDIYLDTAAFAGFAVSAPAALAWLDQLAPGEKFFLFVHGYDAHAFHEGRLAPKCLELYRTLRRQAIVGLPAADSSPQCDWAALYDRAVESMDAHLAPLLERLGRPELASRVVVAAASDHGEELLERGRLDHGMTLFDEALRVPFFLRVPGVRPIIIMEQVGLLSLMPTLLDILGVEPGPALAAQMDAPSLVPALLGEALSLSVASETDFLMRASLRSLRTADGWKLIDDRISGSAALFSIKDDPAEAADRSAAHPKLAKELQSRLSPSFELQARSPEAAALVEGRWKAIYESGRFQLYDFFDDPQQLRDMAEGAQAPALCRSLREKLRPAKVISCPGQR